MTLPVHVTITFFPFLKGVNEYYLSIMPYNKLFLIAISLNRFLTIALVTVLEGPISELLGVVVVQNIPFSPPSFSLFTY